MSDKITITLPPLDRAHYKNSSKTHWAAKARATKKTRTMAGLAALAAISNQKPEGLPWAMATVRAVFHFPIPNGQAGRFDAHNCIHPLQPALDSLQDTNPPIVVNDRDLIVRMPKVVYGDGKPRVEITITKGKT